jgi:hypothetical protein
VKHTIAALMSAGRRSHLNALSGLITVWVALNVLNGCDRPAPSAQAKSVSSETATLIRQADGSELMVITNPQASEGPIATVREMTLPGVLEATGQVTFDDKLVSTISSRLTGRIEEVRSSQWEMVRRGQLIMKLYSPDYMSAEAEYLAAISGGSQRDGPGTETGSFGLPASLSVAASVKEAAPSSGRREAAWLHALRSRATHGLNGYFSRRIQV